MKLVPDPKVAERAAAGDAGGIELAKTSDLEVIYAP
jgi:hypothetical protein